MLLSTSMPTPSASPPRLITLSETSSACSGTKVASSEIGIATAITTVARSSRRKNSSTSTASTPPTIVLSRTSRIDDWMNSAWSERTTTSWPGGRRSLRDALAHRLGDRDEVRVAFAIDRELDRLAPADQRELLALDRYAPDLGDVAHAQLAGAAAAHDDRAQVVGRARLVERAHEVVIVALVDRTAGAVDVVALQRRDHLVGAEPERRESLRIELDHHLLQLATVELHRSHAGDLLELALHGAIGGLAQHREVVDRQRDVAVLRGAQREPHDRLLRRIVAQQDRPLGGGRQRDAIELLAHLGHRLVHRGAPREVEHHVGLPLARDRLDLDDARYRADALLDRSRDQLLDLDRCGVGVDGAHRDRRVARARAAARPEGAAPRPARRAAR